jgi:Xaa-Pro aminopeptidase
LEEVGTKFNMPDYQRARELTKEVVEEVASRVEIGMTERDGDALINQTLEKYNYEKKWHPNKFRIGTNTLKSFKEKSDEGIFLKEEDIYFIDIGPTFNNHEGDFGRTFQQGHNQEHRNIIMACEKVFYETAKACREQGLTGVELYRFAEQEAEKNGYVLNLKMSGHRLGDFPHAVHFRGKLGEVDIVPKENLWVLEILIRHPELSIGIQRSW